MENIFIDILVLLVLSFLLTFAAKGILTRSKVFDIHNERSSHDVPTPRGGGIAFVVLWYVTLIVLVVLEQIPLSLFWALISGILIALISFIDDISGIKPSIRIIAQFLSVSGALFFLNPVMPVSFELFILENNYILLALAVIGGIWFINLFNFLDGIDAYAAMEAILVSLGMYVIVGSELLLLFIAITLGFLIWNWPKAKVFMGDVGSTQLGFVLFVLVIYYHNMGELDILFWLVLSSLFWFDATLTLFRRVRNREIVSKAHKKHAYQRIVQSGFSHQKTVILACAINIIFISVVFVSIRYSLKPIVVLLVMLLLNYGINKMVDKRRPFPKNLVTNMKQIFNDVYSITI